jgi:hypothetical protein
MMTRDPTLMFIRGSYSGVALYGGGYRLLSYP